MVDDEGNSLGEAVERVLWMSRSRHGLARPHLTQEHHATTGVGRCLAVSYVVADVEHPVESEAKVAGRLEEHTRLRLAHDRVLVPVVGRDVDGDDFDTSPGQGLNHVPVYQVQLLLIDEAACYSSLIGDDDKAEATPGQGLEGRDRVLHEPELVPAVDVLAAGRLLVDYTIAINEQYFLRP